MIIRLDSPKKLVLSLAYKEFNDPRFTFNNLRSQPAHFHVMLELIWIHLSAYSNVKTGVAFDVSVFLEEEKIILHLDSKEGSFLRNENYALGKFYPIDGDILEESKDVVIDNRYGAPTIYREHAKKQGYSSNSTFDDSEEESYEENVEEFDDSFDDDDDLEVEPQDVEEEDSLEVLDTLIYYFGSDIEPVIQVSNRLHYNDIAEGSLIHWKNNYYLVISCYTDDFDIINTMRAVCSEYGVKSNTTETYLLEYGKVIIPENALAKLSKNFNA